MEISFGSFRFSVDIWEFPINDFLVLARSDVSGLYILSPSARLIWDTFKSGISFGEVVREFASSYDISLELAAQDVTRTLNEWRSGLLWQQPSPSPSTGS